MAVRRAVVVWAAALAISIGMLALPLVVFAATAAVTIQDSAFKPPTTTIRVGDRVTWTNADAFSHTTTSDTGVWDSGVIRAGGAATITFTTAGTFAYHCSIHSFMKGTVVVQGVSTPAPTPQPTPVPTAPPPPPPTAPLPTPVRTAPPTAPPTQAPTAGPTETAAPATAAPSPSPSASAGPSATQSAAASPSPVAVQVTPAPAPPEGPGTLLIAAAVLAVLGLGAIAIVLARRA
jgi:plastocyanin